MNKKLFVIALSCATIASCLEARRHRSPFAEMHEVFKQLEERFAFFDQNDFFRQDSQNAPTAISYTDTNDALGFTFSHMPEKVHASVGSDRIEITLPDRKIVLNTDKENRFLLITETYQSASEVKNQEDDDANQHYYSRTEAHGHSYSRIPLKEEIKFMEAKSTFDPQTKSLHISIPKVKVEMHPLEITVIDSEEEGTPEKSDESSES